ncbi:MAG: nucleoside triphosphate pyrophosphohydrolase family protein [Clostridia bacterium]|jgi:NTP pyrophosphatase (non-canonical NTP hydrolase)|nr:nucleoside triphosphate pyrophosphohydrolase family protein [Clostridia bacterium]
MNKQLQDDINELPGDDSLYGNWQVNGEFFDKEYSFQDYSKQAISFACYASADYPFFGLLAEAGEVADKLAKKLRGDAKYKNMPKAEFIDGLKKELGDVLWMVNACCKELGIPLESVAKTNIDKLTDRQQRNVLKGDGDNR